MALLSTYSTPWPGVGGSAACDVCGSHGCRRFRHGPYPESYPFLPGGYKVPDGPLAPCRVFNAESGALVAGVGQPIPPGIPLRYEDPALAPPSDPTAPPPPPPNEPPPATTKRGTRARTRRRPPPENRGG